MMTLRQKVRGNESMNDLTCQSNGYRCYVKSQCRATKQNKTLRIQNAIPKFHLLILRHILGNTISPGKQIFVLQGTSARLHLIPYF